MDGIFITGTDTGVGKTVVAAGLLKLLLGSKKVVYWKPIQTGTIVGDDTKTVRGLTDLKEEYFIEPTYRFAEPLAPHQAASTWGKKIELDVLQNVFDQAKAAGQFLVVEGAGGLLLPLSDDTLQIDFIKNLKIPLIIVAEDRVGSINHSVLTINAARDAKIPILGMILTRSRKNLGNAESIAKFGKVPVLAEFDATEDSRTLVAQVGANQSLRDLFSVGILPH